MPYDSKLLPPTETTATDWNHCHRLNSRLQLIIIIIEKLTIYLLMNTILKLDYFN